MSCVHTVLDKGWTGLYAGDWFDSRQGTEQRCIHPPLDWFSDDRVRLFRSISKPKRGEGGVILKEKKIGDWLLLQRHNPNGCIKDNDGDSAHNTPSILPHVSHRERKNVHGDQGGKTKSCRS